MTSKSQAVVDFLASLIPLYVSEQHGGSRCARSLHDGTLVLPVDESDQDEACGTVRVHWQGDPARACGVAGYKLVTLAFERYVRLHGVGASEEAIAAELWHMAQHFTFKTGCEVYLPNLPEPAHPVVRAGRTALRMGEGVLVNAISKMTGLS